PTAKQIRTDDISSPTENPGKVDINQSTSSSLLSTLKELNANFAHLRQQVASLSDKFDQNENTLDVILQNQKRLAKAMRQYKIPIALVGETDSQTSTATHSKDPLISKSSTGEEVDLLLISADKTKPNKFVLSAIDKLFTDKDLFAIDPRSMEDDHRILSIQNAVQIKFGLKTDELRTVWQPMLECDNISDNDNENQLPSLPPSIPQNINNAETHEHF
ncbi:unnamed protein product, partial [Rotaria sp. Silwood2]